MKECFLIISYCNTEKKQKILIDNICNLSSYGPDIILYSHYPLNSDIQKMVDFYIYSTNPIVSGKSIFFWQYFNKLKITHVMLDHTYTVLKQFSEGINFIINLSKYDIIYVINYDTYLSDDLFKKQRELVNEKGSVFYKNFTKMDIEKNEDNLGMFGNVLMSIFGIKTDHPNINALLNFTIENYNMSKFYCEHYFYNEIIKPNNFYIERREYFRELIYESYKTSVDVFNMDVLYEENIITDVFELYKIDDFYLFAGLYEKNYSFFIWNISKNILLEINDQKYDINENNFLINTYIPSNVDIKVSVNGLSIDELIVNQYKNNRVEIED